MRWRLTWSVITMFNYPNPCNTCKNPCDHRRGCSDWQIWFHVVWKRFNSYPLRQYKAAKKEKTKFFVYEHPDVLRKYLAEGPCKKCKNEQTCDIPCMAYYAWWDARMTMFQRKYGGSENANQML